MFYVALVVDIISSVFDSKLNHTTHTSKHNFSLLFFLNRQPSQKKIGEGDEDIFSVRLEGLLDLVWYTEDVLAPNRAQKVKEHAMAVAVVEKGTFSH